MEYSLCVGRDCRDMVCGEMDRTDVEGFCFLQCPFFIAGARRML